MSDVPHARLAATFAEVEDALQSRWPETRLEPSLDRIRAFAEQLGEGADPVERGLEPRLRTAGLEGVLDLREGGGEARVGYIGHVAVESRETSLHAEIRHVDQRLVAERLVDPVRGRVGLVGEEA